MTNLAIDDIKLKPNHNVQGGHVVMNLKMGKRLPRNKITAIQMTNIAKQKDKHIFMDQGISRIKFTNIKGIELPNVEWIAGVNYEKKYIKRK